MPAASDRPFHSQRTSTRRPDSDGPRPGAHRPPSAPAGQETVETHYQLLGVPYGAQAADITRAYREAMKRSHPDRVRPERRAAAEDLAKRLNHAYAVLSKPASRQSYDQTIRVQGVQEQIMGRYVGGFSGPGLGGAHDPFAADLRRPASDFERRDRARAGRSATITMMATFAGFTLAIILAMFAFTTIAWVFGRIF